MKMVNAIFIFTGEWGYELLSFQGILRRYRYMFNELHVCSFPGREILYQDFVTSFVPLPPLAVQKINPSTNKEEGFPLFNYVKEYLGTKFDLSRYEIISTHSHKFFYPIDEKLDLTGEDGKYIKFLSESYIEPERRCKEYLAIFPRYHHTHPHRNYDKWEKALDLLLKLDYNLHLVLVLFGDKHPLKDYKNKRVIKYFEPTVERQVSIINHSLCSVFSHSGAVFLTLFCKRPVFSFAIPSDYYHIYKHSKIFSDLDIAAVTVNAIQDDLSTVSASLLVKEIDSYIKIIKNTSP